MNVTELIRKLEGLVKNDEGHLEVLIRDHKGDTVSVKDITVCSISYFGCGCNSTEKPHCRLY